MAMKARDIMGCLLLLLVLTEASRKWMYVSDLSKAQPKESATQVGMHQIARRLLTPARPGSEIPALCRTPGPECAEGASVKCMHGTLVGCDCDFIQLCYPHVAECALFNSTHVVSCGF